MGNKDAIEYALKVLYSKELNPESENISGETSDLSEADMEYALAVVEEYQSHSELIDHMIESHLINWSMKQLNVVDKNILRTAIAEYLKLNGEVLNDLQTIFKEKHQILLTEGLSEERKIVLTRFVETKLNSLFTAEQIAKLKLDDRLYKKLTRN